MFFYHKSTITIKRNSTQKYLLFIYCNVVELHLKFLYNHIFYDRNTVVLFHSTSIVDRVKRKLQKTIFFQILFKRIALFLRVLSPSSVFTIHLGILCISKIVKRSFLVEKMMSYNFHQGIFFAKIILFFVHRPDVGGGNILVMFARFSCFLSSFAGLFWV